MIHSPHQLRLRILTGTHAGAEISLSQGQYVIGSDPTCDVVISDWTFRKSKFEVKHAGADEFIVQFDEEALAEPFGIDQSRRIGDIAIAVSLAGENQRRQTDIALLTQLLAPAPVVPPARAGISRWVIAGFVLCIAATTAFTLHGTGSAASARILPVTDNSPLAKVRSVVSRLQFPSIRVIAEGESVVVSGLLKDAAERKALVQKLATIKGVTVLQRYAVESEISAAITDALAQPGLTVTHLGGGKFEIGGEVTPALRQKTDLARLKADLGPLVKSLSFVEPAEPPEADVEFDELRMKQGYEFRIASDGTKYFVPKGVQAE
jgi:type III secretion protein D